MDRLIKRHPHLLARFLSALLHSPLRDDLKEVQAECRFQKRATPFPGLHSHSTSEGNNENEFENLCFRSSCALNNELGQTRAHIKLVAAWTGANERTVKNWFAGNYGPSGDHLVTLIRYSDTVLSAVLSMSNRQNLLKTSKSSEIERRLIELTSLVQNQDESDN